MSAIIEGLNANMYLGDGVYVGNDGFQLWIYTSDGIRVTNRIALEPSVLKALSNYVAETCDEQ